MDPSWLTGIGTLVLAAATVALALVTVWSVRKSIEANRSLREENERYREQEKERTAKIHALEIIAKWADEVSNILDEEFSMQSAASLEAILGRCHNTIVDEAAVTRASKLFQKDFQEMIKTARTSYNVFFKTVNALYDSYKRTELEFDRVDWSEGKRNVNIARTRAQPSLWDLQRYVREYKIVLLL